MAAISAPPTSISEVHDLALLCRRHVLWLADCFNPFVVETMETDLQKAGRSADAWAKRRDEANDAKTVEEARRQADAWTQKREQAAARVRGRDKTRGRISTELKAAWCQAAKVPDDLLDRFTIDLGTTVKLCNVEGRNGHAAIFRLTTRVLPYLMPIWDAAELAKWLDFLSLDELAGFDERLHNEVQHAPAPPNWADGPSRIISPDEAASLLNIHRRTFTDLVKAGKLPAEKLTGKTYRVASSILPK